MEDERSDPWVWMALAALGLVVAIALGIWVYSLRSNVDDRDVALTRADATIEQQREQLEALKQGAAGVEGSDRSIVATDEESLRRLELRYRRVRGRFISEEREAGALRSDVAREAARLQRARDEFARATDRDARLAAQVRTARAQRRVAAACARRALAQIDTFFDEDVSADEASDAFDDLEKQCAAEVGG